MQHTREGFYESKWISLGQADEDSEDILERNLGDIQVQVQVQVQVQTHSDLSTPMLSGSADAAVSSKLKEAHSGHTGNTVLLEDSVPSSPSPSAEVEAEVSRDELAAQCIQAVGARKFKAAAIGAGALVAAYGCRQASSAVCWLLQLQR